MTGVQTCALPIWLVPAWQREMPVDAGWYLVAPRRPREQATVSAVRAWLLSQAEQSKD